MATIGTIPIHLYARVANSEILNEIGTIELDAVAEIITEENRRPNDALEAKTRVTGNLAAALRSAADKLDAQQPTERHNKETTANHDPYHCPRGYSPAQCILDCTSRR